MSLRLAATRGGAVLGSASAPCAFPVRPRSMLPTVSKWFSGHSTVKSSLVCLMNGVSYSKSRMMASTLVRALPDGREEPTPEEYVIVNFYYLKRVEDPDQVVSQQQHWLKTTGTDIKVSRQQQQQHTFKRWWRRSHQCLLLAPLCVYCVFSRAGFIGTTRA